MSSELESIQNHYGSGGLLNRILAGLHEAGIDPNAPAWEQLAPVDQFHSLGLVATRSLAEFASLQRGQQVLDVGSGLGGPARFLAAEYGCDVTGVDLTPEFCAVATDLSRRTGWAERTRFQQGDALYLPFEDAAFDCAWTLQAQMNIADKARLYGEIARVLRPGGRLVFQDVCAGNGQPLDFPVPWASSPEQSHLATPEGLCAAIEQAGLRQQQFRNVTEQILAGQKGNRPTASQALPPLGLHLVMGASFGEKRANSGRAMRDGRIVSVQGVFGKLA